MWNQESIIKSLEERQQALSETIELLEERLNLSPEGYIAINKKKGKTFFYQTTWQGGKRTRKYLPRGDQRVSALFQKAYDKAEVVQLKEELKSIESLLVTLKAKKDIYHALGPIKQSYIKPIICPDEEFLSAWKAAPYKRKQNRTEDLIFHTNEGTDVRSKSEAFIANALFEAGIPYRYEALLTIESYSFYPDFTIMNPRLRKVVYWEHLGMMDQPDYVKDMIRRLDIYERNNILLGEQLILTFESQRAPLNLEIIQQKIDHYCR